MHGNFRDVRSEDQAANKEGFSSAHRGRNHVKNEQKKSAATNNGKGTLIKGDLFSKGETNKRGRTASTLVEEKEHIGGGKK